MATTIGQDILDEPIILSARCSEPEGSIVRSVRSMTLTPSNLHKFWEHSRQFKTLFTKEVNDDFLKFLELFIVSDKEGLPIDCNGLFWVVDDFVGVLYMTDIKPGYDALVHYTFFDRRQRGRQPLIRKMLKYVFEHYGFRRLTVEIPKYAVDSTNAFVRSLNFKEEGRKRKAAYYENQWFDVMIYGILREEVIYGF